MKSRIILVALFSISLSRTIAVIPLPPPEEVQIGQQYGQIPVRFEPNSGQTDPEIQYFSRGNGYTMYFVTNQVIVALDMSTNLTDGSRATIMDSASQFSHDVAIFRIHLTGVDDSTE